MPAGEPVSHSQQLEYWNIVWNMFKVNNKDTRTSLVFSVFIVNFEPISHISIWANCSVSIADFEKVNTSREP